MVSARRQHEGLLAAWHLAGIIAFMPLTGKSLSPRQINPFAATGTGSARKLDEIKAFIAMRGLAALGH